jgi:hypothetical protein
VGHPTITEGTLLISAPLHTVDYDPFIKSQLASINQYQGLLWSRNTPETGPNKTLVLHRVAGRVGEHHLHITAEPQLRGQVETLSSKPSTLNLNPKP